ncbi:MAG: hypothetical protein FJ240_08790 [Nitrospira sp.]|nr:hypothetical protein [Nitrospira sp.]
MKITLKTIITGFFAMLLIIGFSGNGNSIEKEKVPIAPLEKKLPSMQPSPGQRVSPPITDGGGDEMYNPGVDLVVSKVEMQRGIFMGAQKIRIITTIKNMWRGSTSTRIKIMFYTLDMAEWIEGGIGPNEEIRAGAIYVNDPTGTRALNFSVMVDNNNEIPENNDMNHRCDNINLSSSETNKVYNCPIIGPHEPLI